MSAYSQFGFPYATPSQLLVPAQTTSPSGSSPCCDSGRPLFTDPLTGQSVCSCQCDRTLGYSRIGGATGAAVSTPVCANPYTDQVYPGIGVDTTGFYSQLSGYGLKDGSGADMNAWTGFPQPGAAYYSYDHTLTPYGYGAYDLNAARRKNATRETTATLKAWISEHKKNPYPTKGEKIMLAIITKMTLTQVSTWFANARRRLKKDNKMTWEPKNKTDDDDGDSDIDAKDDDLDDDESKEDLEIDSKIIKSEPGENPASRLTACTDDPKAEISTRNMILGIKSDIPSSQRLTSSNFALTPVSPFTNNSGLNQTHPLSANTTDGKDNSTKPKIWSLADTATCKTPPPPPTHIIPTPSAHNSQWLSSVGHYSGFPAPHSQYPYSSLSYHHPTTTALMSYGASAYSSANGMVVSAPSSGHSASSILHAGYSSRSGVPTYPEASADTPPQTPPNMKGPSVPGTGSSIPTTQSYSAPSNDHSVASMYSGHRALFNSVNARLKALEHERAKFSKVEQPHPQVNPAAYSPSTTYSAVGFSPAQSSSVKQQDNGLNLSSA